jgi:hypothetical protein
MIPSFDNLKDVLCQQQVTSRGEAVAAPVVAAVVVVVTMLVK